MNLFVWLWDSWHVKGWDHPEKSALLRVLHELYLCDYEFAATEKGQYKRFLEIMKESGATEPTLQCAVQLLLSTRKTEETLYRLIATAVLCDFKYTPEERAFLEELKAQGFNPDMLDACVRQEKARQRNVQDIETSKLGDLLSRYLEILRRFSGANMPWRRLSDAIKNWLSGTPFEDVQVPLLGDTTKDASLLNQLLGRAGLVFTWHGQFAGHQVYEIRIADERKLASACGAGDSTVVSSPSWTVEPFLDAAQCRRIREAETRYGLEWVEFPRLESNRSCLDAEADFRFFGEVFDRCYRVNLRRVLDAYERCGSRQQALDMLKDTASAFGQELQQGLSGILAAAFARGPGPFFVAHDLFWKHLNRLLLRLLGLDGIPIQVGLLLEENMEEVLWDCMPRLRYVVFLAPEILGDWAIHNLVVGPVLAEEDVAEEFLGETIRCKLVRYRAEQCAAAFLVGRSCYSSKRGLILLDAGAQEKPLARLGGAVWEPADRQAWDRRHLDLVVFHEKVHCLFNALVGSTRLKTVRLGDKEYPSDVGRYIMSEVWARLVSWYAFPDLTPCEMSDVPAMRLQGTVYRQTAEWILDRLKITRDMFEMGGGFFEGLQDNCLHLLENSISEMRAQGWAVGGLQRLTDYLKQHRRQYLDPAENIVWVPVPESEGGAGSAE